MNQRMVDRIIDAALEEDLGFRDLTSELVVPVECQATAEIQAREDGLVAGLLVAKSVFERVDPSVVFSALAADGDQLMRDQTAARISGSARSILAAERTALNLLQRMSGIATMTAAFVRACAGARARIVDTRKTAPGLRILDKYAVLMGGGSNLRMGLFDGVLIKENHLRAAGGVEAAVQAARAGAPHTLKIEVECDTLEQADQAANAGADIILLDNMTVDQMTEAVRRIAGRAMVEASGNMTLARIPNVAATGVDFISVGALTHSVKALDLSLEITDWNLAARHE